MRFYTVELTLRCARRLNLTSLFNVAEIGVACGNPRGRRLEATLEIKAGSLPQAAARGIRRLTGLVPGEVVAVNAMTHREADRRFRAMAPKK